MFVKNVCTIIPGRTSRLRCVPPYEAQIIRHREARTGAAGPDLPHEISFPQDLPAASRVTEVEDEPSEINRLVAAYDFELVASVFPPNTSAFTKAFEAAVIDAETRAHLTQALERAEEEEEDLPTSELEALGVKLTPEQTKSLTRAGLGEVANLAGASVDVLVDRHSLTRPKATKLVDAAKAAMAYHQTMQAPEEFTPPTRLSASLAEL